MFMLVGVCLILSMMTVLGGQSTNTLALGNEVEDELTGSELALREVDQDGSRCRIEVDGDAAWFRMDEETELEGMLLYVKAIDAGICEVDIFTPEDPIGNVDLRIIKIDVSDEYVEDGESIRIKARVHNQGDVDLENVEWVFYNNGYPDGEGATIEITGVIEKLKSNDKQTVEVVVAFHAEDDVVQGTGSFILFFIVDPENKINEESESNNIHGATVHVQPNRPQTLLDKTLLDKKSAPRCIENKIIREGGDETFYLSDGTKIGVENLIIEETNSGTVTLKVGGKVTQQLKKTDYYPVRDNVGLYVQQLQYGSYDGEDSVWLCLMLNGPLGPDLGAMAAHPAQEPPQAVTPGELSTASLKQAQSEAQAPPQAVKELLHQKRCDNGCFINSQYNRCIPIGTRIVKEDVPVYCDLSGGLEPQREDNEDAQNNYECVSNFASSGTCVPVKENLGILKKMFGWLGGIFG